MNYSAISKAITKRNGRSFYLASHILGAKDRQRAFDVYALCRLMDDATDEDSPVDDSQLSESGAVRGADLSSEILSEFYDSSKLNPHPPFHGKPQTLLAFSHVIHQCLGYPANGSFQLLSSEELQCYLAHLKHAVVNAGITHSHFQALLNGQRSDETFKQPKSFREFYEYCFQVAGVVGLMMALVFQARNSPEIMKAAEHLGIAMQITNILRDIREDALQRQRVYLPSDLLRSYSLDPDDLMSKDDKHGHRTDMVRALAQVGLGYYKKAIKGVPGIPNWRCRLCVRLMTAIYGAILASILRSPACVFSERVIIPSGHRLWIALKVLSGVDPLRAAGFTKTDLCASSSAELLLAGEVDTHEPALS